jgi:hypothetical protein
MKMTLKIENWLWFPSYRRDIIRLKYHTVDMQSGCSMSLLNRFSKIFEMLIFQRQ